jgi:hypothetical protein
MVHYMQDKKFGNNNFVNYVNSIMEVKICKICIQKLCSRHSYLVGISELLSQT